MHLFGSAFCLSGIGKALGVVPLGFVQDKFLNFHVHVHGDVSNLLLP